MTPSLSCCSPTFFAYLPPVVKYHALSAARGLPALSLAPVVILAQHLLFASSLEAGFSVTVLEVIIRLRRFFQEAWIRCRWESQPHRRP